VNPDPPHCAYLATVQVATGGLDVVVEVVVTLVELLVGLALVELVEEDVGLALEEVVTVDELDVAVLLLAAEDELEEEEEPLPPPLTVPEA
jgi:hypothetical protein